MRTLNVEVTEEEYTKLVALRSADIMLSHHTVERYLGLTLAMGGRLRATGLQLAEASDEVWGFSDAPKVPARSRGRAGWRNGAA